MDNLQDRPRLPVPSNDGLLLEKIFNLINKFILLPAAAEFEPNI